MYTVLPLYNYNNCATSLLFLLHYANNIECQIIFKSSLGKYSATKPVLPALPALARLPWQILQFYIIHKS